MVLAVAVILICSGCSLLGRGLDINTKRYAKYVKTSLDCSFLGVTEEYLKEVDATQEEADETYKNTVDGYVSLLMYNFEVNEEYVSEETAAAFREKAVEIMKGASYTVADAVKNSDGDYSVTVTIKPIDLFDAVSYQEAADWYNKTYTEEAIEAMTNEEYAAAEEEYAKKILELVSAYQVAYKEEMKCTVTILDDEENNMYSVSEADWTMLDENILGIELD